MSQDVSKSPAQTIRVSQMGVFTHYNPFKVRAISGTSQGKTRQEAIFDTINIEWRSILSNNGADFFTVRYKESAIMVYPIQITQFNRFIGPFKKEKIDAVLIFDNESFLALIDHEMKNWLSPAVNLIAVGFTPSCGEVDFPADLSIIKNTIVCLADSNQSVLFSEILRNKTKEPTTTPAAPKARTTSINETRSAKSCKECSII